MKSPVSIALFLLLSAFFLFALLAALQRSGKALGIALVCLAACVCIVIFLTPVKLPSWWPLKNKTTTTTVVGVPDTTTTTLGGVTITTTTEAAR